MHPIASRSLAAEHRGVASVGRRSRVLGKLTLAAAALVLAGCTKLGPEFTRPEAQVNEEWKAADGRIELQDISEYTRWWQTFDDTVLDTLIDTAYRQNLSLQSAGVRILEARAQLGIAVGRIYPQQQEALGSAIYNQGSKNVANASPGTDFTFWSNSIGLSAAWEIDIWGRFRRGIESESANVLASIANYDDVLVSLTAEVASAYVVIRTFEERLAIARNNVEIQERSLRIADVRFRNGATTELDVQQAKTLLANTQATIPDLEAGLKQAQNALAILLGLPPTDMTNMLAGTSAIPTAPKEVAVGIPAELLRRRPDVRRAELQAAAQSALIGVAQSDLYPRFSLVGTIGFSARDGATLFSSDSVVAQAGPSVTWNIFNWGRIKNNVRVQDARYEQLIKTYQNTVLSAAREVEDAMVGFLKAQEASTFLDQSVVAANRSVELALIQYRDGATDYTRVLQTQGSLVQQQDLATSTRGNIVNNLVAMYRSLGGGWEIRAGNDFVPEDIKRQMAERTDWGELLKREAVDIPPPAEAGDTLRSPDW